MYTSDLSTLVGSDVLQKGIDIMFARPIGGTRVKVVYGPHKDKIGTVKTKNTAVGMVRVHVDGFGSGDEILHLPIEYVKIVTNK